jgi:ABC-type glycerol-3-phosphate transport system substrate-binding protein
VTWSHYQRLAPLGRGLRGSVLAALVAAMAFGLARPSHAATATPKTLRLWYGSDDPAEQSWVRQVVQRFGARYPTVQVTLSFYDLDDLISSALTAVLFQRAFLAALATATPGVYVDAAPIPNFLATMEAHLQLLLKGRETPHTLTQRLQDVYASRGRTATFTRTDGES